MNKLILFCILGMFLLIGIIGISAYSTYGSPSEFGNDTDTTCFVGGDDGIVNCTGNAKFGGDLNVTGDIFANDGRFDYLNFSILFSNFGGAIDARGDPWYLSGTDLEIAENLIVDGNITTTDTGFFGWVGSLASRITKLWAQDIDFSGSISGIDWTNITGSGITNNLNWLNITQNNLLFNQTELVWIVNTTALSINTTANIQNLLNSTGIYSTQNDTYEAINTTANIQNLINGTSDALTLNGKIDSHFMPDNKSVVGNFDFNGGWTAGGFSIVGGDIYAQTGFFYNISGLSVTYLKVNGSLFPYFDNSFDIGNSSHRWRDLHLSGEVNVTGAGDNYFAGNVGIGTVSPVGKLDVNGSIHTSGKVYTTLSTTISPGGGYIDGGGMNLMSFASSTFETSKTGWTGRDGLTVSSSDEQAYSGNKSLKAFSDSAESQFQFGANVGDVLQNDTETDFVATAWVYLPTAGGLTGVFLQYRDGGAGFFNEGTAYTSYRVTTLDGWQKIVLPFTANATSGNGFLWFWGEGAATGDYMYIDNVQIQRGSIPTEHSPLSCSVSGDCVLLDGKVGIGTASPTQKLEVAGNVNITGNISMGDAFMFTDASGNMIFRI